MVDWPCDGRRKSRYQGLSLVGDTTERECCNLTRAIFGETGATKGTHVSFI